MDSQRLIDKYPDRVPIIIRDTELVDKKKYLVPIECTVAQFNYIIRKRMKNVSDEKAIFIFLVAIAVDPSVYICQSFSVSELAFRWHIREI